MSSEETCEETSEDERVHEWRVARFVSLGFEVSDAGYLAESYLVDTHYVARLLARGCSHALALEITL